jgi:hypothetical protein
MDAQLFEVLDLWTDTVEEEAYLALCNRLLAYVLPRMHTHAALDDDESRDWAAEVGQYGSLAR